MDPSRYADLFRTESREQLTAINRALLALEQGEAAREPVDAIFRGVHTIKGMSATMGYTGVAEFSHELESILEKVRAGAQGLSSELMDAFFAGADALEDGIEQAREDGAMSAGMRRALARLHDVAGGRSTSEFRVAGPNDAPDDTPAAIEAAGAVAGVDAGAGAGAGAGVGAVVRVTQVPEALLPGVRAFMVLQRLRTLGEIAQCDPPLEQLQVATTPQRFQVRVVTPASVAEIERAVRSAGDIALVEVEISAVSSDPTTPDLATASAPTFDRRATDQARTTHVRIELSRLDALLNLIGELVIVRGRLQALMRAGTDGALSQAMTDAMTEASALISNLQVEIMTSRLVPVGQVFDRFPRLVRDVARQLGKEVLFNLEGKDIEIDRSVLDEIGEPVVHLLRNAVDHGLETPEVREATGKARAGRITLAAQRDRSAVVISVRDDGQGIDRARVLTRGQALGLVAPGTTRLDDEALLRCIAHPGFSTAEQVTDVSGRGVGIDVVQSRARALGGALEMTTAPGAGTTMKIRLPITLAIVRALVARVGEERYALPVTQVRETMAHGSALLRRVAGREMLVLRDEVLPLLRLREVVQLPEAVAAMSEEIVVIERGDRRSGLVVDEITGQEDIVVKSFDAVRGGAALFSGATILADGAPALILDAGSLL